MPPIQVTVGAVVTLHRMAVSLSPEQTVLWDQIEYSGTASDFAWVLPVRDGARIELSTDAWLAALDASTAPVLIGPTPACGGSAPVQDEGSGGGCGGSASNAASVPAPDDSASSTPSVDVVSQSVVGPYESVTVRSSQGEALDAWLVQNGYDVPASIQPTIDAYTEAGFDFIALKLRPGEGVQAMQPVRVIMPGAGTTFPLRMVAAGVGANVALELFVLSQGRYHPQNFPDATIDFSKLAWNPYTSLSNYETLAQQAMSASGGTAWLTEFAGLADLGATPSGAINPGLGYAYSTTCVQSPPVCTSTALPDDEGGVDANDDGTDGTDGEGGGEAGDESAADAAALASDAEGGNAPATPASPTCTAGVLCDDLSLAMTGIDLGSLWVTRLRANFPSAALTADLVIEATAAQVPATNVHTTQTYTDPTYNPCPSGSNATGGGSSPGSLGGCGCRTAEARRRRNADVIGLAFVAAAVAFGARRRRRLRRVSRP